MTTTGTITFDYDGCQNFGTHTVFHIDVIVVNSNRETVFNTKITFTVHEKVDTAVFSETYNETLNMYVNKMRSFAEEQNGEFYNVQFLGL